MHGIVKVRANIMTTDQFETLRMELRRGSIPLAVLAELRHEQYGYTLRKVLADLGMDVDEGTLYPLLRRLESHGLLTSEWRAEDNRPKRFYRLSGEGRRILDRLAAEWGALTKSLEEILKESGHGSD
jgi:DNA-binding PadR family transcriptional regulator